MEQENKQRKMMFIIRQNNELNEQGIRDALLPIEGIIVSPFLGSGVVFERDERGIKGPKIYPEIRGICPWEKCLEIGEALNENAVSYSSFRVFDPLVVDPDSAHPMDDEDYVNNLRERLKNQDYAEYLDDMEADDDF